MICVFPKVYEKRKQTMTERDAIHIFQISQRNLHRRRATDSYRYLLEHGSRLGLKRKLGKGNIS
jgi:hypothetical protein